MREEVSTPSGFVCGKIAHRSWLRHHHHTQVMCVGVSEELSIERAVVEEDESNNNAFHPANLTTHTLTHVANPNMTTPLILEIPFPGLERPRTLSGVKMSIVERIPSSKDKIILKY